jgi:hypothetical protein
MTDFTSLSEYIAEGGGICGTCAQPARATAENEGYSSCCNDRIEYFEEAQDTVNEDRELNADLEGR